MKRIFKAAVAAVGFTALATSAMAEWTPPGPIKLMIAFAAGGGADTQARMIAEELENKLAGNSSRASDRQRRHEPCDGDEGSAE